MSYENAIGKAITRATKIHDYTPAGSDNVTMTEIPRELAELQRAVQQLQATVGDVMTRTEVIRNMNPRPACEDEPKEVGPSCAVGATMRQIRDMIWQSERTLRAFLDTVQV